MGGPKAHDGHSSQTTTLVLDRIQPARLDDLDVGSTVVIVIGGQRSTWTHLDVGDAAPWADITMGERHSSLLLQNIVMTTGGSIYLLTIPHAEGVMPHETSVKAEAAPTRMVVDRAAARAAAASTARAAAASAADTATSTVPRRVEELLKVHGGEATSAWIAEALGVEMRLVRSALQDLRRRHSRVHRPTTRTWKYGPNPGTKEHE